MTSPETTPVRDLSRAYWQRSEAAVIYSEVFDQLLDSLGRGVSDNLIVDHLEEVEADPWSTLNHLVHLPYMMFSAADLPKFSTSLKFERTVGRRVHEYTYEGNFLRTADEGLKTMMAFPAVFLKLLDEEHRQTYRRPLVTNLLSVYQVCGSADFSQIIHDAAFAPNGYWPGRFSELPVSLDDKFIEQNKTQMPVFKPAPRSRVGLILDTKLIHDHITRNNAQGDSSVIPGEADLGNLATSGCPVRLNRAQFTARIEDRDRLAELSDLTKQSVDELLLPRASSGIQQGLDFTTELLKRAVVLDKHRRIGRKAVGSP